MAEMQILINSLNQSCPTLIIHRSSFFILHLSRADMMKFLNSLKTMRHGNKHQLQRKKDIKGNTQWLHVILVETPHPLFPMYGPMVWYGDVLHTVVLSVILTSL